MEVVQDLVFALIVERAVHGGLRAAALVDRNGNTVAHAGDISDDEAMPLAALVMYRLKRDDLSERMFAGETLSLAFDDRAVAVGVAKRQLFFVAVADDDTPETHERVRDLRRAVESVLADMTIDHALFLPWTGSGGSGSGPAELPVVELGITVPRGRGKPN